MRPKDWEATRRIRFARWLLKPWGLTVYKIRKAPTKSSKKTAP